MLSSSASIKAKIRSTTPSTPKTPSPNSKGSPKVSTCDLATITSSLFDRPDEEEDSMVILGEVWDPLDYYSQFLIQPSPLNSPPSRAQDSTTDSLSTRYDMFLRAFRKLPPVSKPRILTQENPRRRSFWRRNKNEDRQPSSGSVAAGQDENPKVDGDGLDIGWVETDLPDDVWSIHSNDSTEAVDRTEAEEVKDIKQEIEEAIQEKIEEETMEIKEGIEEETSTRQTEQCHANARNGCGVEHQKSRHPRVHPLFAARYGDDPNWCCVSHSCRCCNTNASRSAIRHSKRGRRKLYCYPTKLSHSCNETSDLSLFVRS
ncbi:hypothetical protein K449DRAFT_199308 [Hypoxylon sp. EC38]|nr:hypothetical protein K449DRAFT_199308 [Hypoxylon sp. EC38]